MTLSNQLHYVQRVLELYRDTPGTSGRVRPADRRLAKTFYQREVPVSTVRAALLLAVSRRTFRTLETDPPQTIRSLHYFQHVIQELLDQPLPDGYLDYLCWKLAPLPPSLSAPDDHQIP
ncbi:MAG: hypothetical protein GY925_13040 [Actinomycetia bacterium]|nr:hypothetical protein [Actinomycetes bacterium]